MKKKSYNTLTNIFLALTVLSAIGGQQHQGYLSVFLGVGIVSTLLAIGLHYFYIWQKSPLPALNVNKPFELAWIAPSNTVDVACVNGDIKIYYAQVLEKLHNDSCLDIKQEMRIWVQEQSSPDITRPLRKTNKRHKTGCISKQFERSSALQQYQEATA